MRWREDGGDWPMSAHSRFVLSRPHRWHVQEAGEGRLLLLIHGAGGASQSWRGLFPLLSKSFRVVAVDLPGQGFTQCGARQRCGLDGMAEDLVALMTAEGWQGATLIGHSAGAALALRMSEMTDTPAIIGINAALANFPGVAGWLFPMMARALALNPLSAGLITSTMREGAIRRLISGTGSTIDAEGIALYQRLASDRGHVDATLAMMAQWELEGLLSRLPQLTTPVHLIVGTRDAAVPPRTSREAAARLPNATLTELAGLGHLAHEEAPEKVADIIMDALK